MGLWIALVIAVVAAVVCVGYIAISGMDPEGRSSPHEDLFVAGQASSEQHREPRAGALVHRVFTTT